MKKLETLQDFITLERNTKITVSDDTEEPPKHHKRKHASWSLRNYTGYLYGTEQLGGPLYIKIASKIGSMFVNNYRVSGSLSFYIDEPTIKTE